MHVEPTDAVALPRPVAFVLGGGGSLGAIQVGMLEALAERGIVPDLVVGTSVGAINGAVMADDPDGAAERLAHAWAHFDADRVFPRGVIGRVRTLHEHHNHLYLELGLAALLAEHLPTGATIEGGALPLRVVTTDVATGEPVVLTSGPLLPALMASAAVPGVFPPVERDGRLLYDGGLVANVPVQQAVHAGARSLVVLDCTFPGQPPIRPTTLLDAILFSAMVVLRQQTAAALAAVPADVPVLQLPGPAPLPVSPLDFDHTLTLMDFAYDAARAYLVGTGHPADAS